jgi:RND family efflux transporter MFP subunit
MKDILMFFRKRIVIIIIVIAFAGIGFIYFGSNNKLPADLITVERSQLIQEITITGKIKPVQVIDLAFEKVGKVSGVYVNIGDKVSAGQILVELERNDLNAQLRESLANFDVQNAKLDGLKRGSTKEEIQVTQTELEKAKQILVNYYAGVPNIVSSAYNKASDAVRNQLDAFFSDDEQTNARLTYSTANNQAQIDAENQRRLITNELNNWQLELSFISANSNSSELDKILKTSEDHLLAVKKLIEIIDNTLNSPNSLPQSTLTTYKASIYTASANNNTALTSVKDQEQLISAQTITAQKARDELNLKLSGSTLESIKAQEALVEQAAAQIDGIRAQIFKTTLRSPINGTITKEEVKLGEIVTANSLVVSIISANNLEIEANIAEADIAKIKIGQSAKVTLDAYGNDVVFDAKIVFIEPAETIIEGVSTYKTKLQFDKEDDRIKSGMTANVDILTDTRENTLVIPQRAVYRKDGEESVLIYNDGSFQERKIRTGLRGSDGNIEVLEGLIEGENIANTSTR